MFARWSERGESLIDKCEIVNLTEIPADQCELVIKLHEKAGSQRPQNPKLIGKILGAFAKCVESLRARFFGRDFQSLPTLLVCFLHALVEMFAFELVQRPCFDAIERLAQAMPRFLRPFRKCGEETIQLEGEKIFRLTEAAFSAARIPTQLPDSLEANLGVADIRNELPDLAQRSVFTVPDIAFDFASCEG